MNAQMTGGLTDSLGSTSYFFYADRYIRYKWASDSVDNFGSLPLFLWRLPESFLNGVDAVCDGAQSYADYRYFFKGENYVRYSWSNDICDYGVQTAASLAAEWNLPEPFSSGIDAALCGQGRYSGYVYFFQGGQYARYSWQSGSVDLVASLANWAFPNLFSGGVEAVVNGQGQYTGKAYFFRRGQYIRYDWDTEQVDPGFPASLTAYWPTLLEPTTLTRCIVPYVTLDPYAGADDPENRANHRDNVAGLRGIAAQADPPLIVPQLWCPNINQRVLCDRHVLALFLAGSYTEWAGYYADSVWREMLDTWVGLIRETNVPIFAVCGSHQLVASAYGGWSAVGHMTESGSPVPISTESNGVPQIPNPRLHEQGIFSVDKLIDDGILFGMPNRMVFPEYHSDEVIVDALPAGTATILAAGVSLADCYQDAPTLRDSAQRCHAQLMRYNVRPSGRMLYTSQFHPEIGPELPPAWVAAAPQLGAQAVDCSRKLLLRFFHEAKQFWQTATLHLPPLESVPFNPLSRATFTPARQFRRPAALMG
jgi:GMP synthase-like glutamine amidotransferase